MLRDSGYSTACLASGIWGRMPIFPNASRFEEFADYLAVHRLFRNGSNGEPEWYEQDSPFNGKDTAPT
jgi:hypothetical protein